MHPSDRWCSARLSRRRGDHIQRCFRNEAGGDNGPGVRLWGFVLREQHGLCGPTGLHVAVSAAYKVVIGL